MSGMGAKAPQKTANKPRAGLLFLLLAAMGAGPLFNYGVSTLSAIVIEHFGITEGQVGLIITVVFGSAALSSVWLGSLADRISSRMQMLILFIGPALAFFVALLSQQYWVLLLGALIAGPTQAISNPTTNRVILNQVPLAQQSNWLGIKQSGVQASQLFAGIFFPLAALWAGWVGAAGAGAVLMFLLWAYSLTIIPREPVSRTKRKDRTRPTRQEKRAANTTEKLPTRVYAYALMALLAGFGMQATNVYLPLFSMQALNFSLVTAGSLVAVAGTVGVVSRIGWAWLMRSSASSAQLLVIISLGASLGVGSLLLVFVWPHPALLWIATFLHGVTILGANVVINAELLRSVPNTSIGRASGINSAGMYTGFASGPLIAGLLRDITGAFWIGWWCVLGFYVLFGVIALVLHLKGNKQPDSVESEATV